MGVPIGNLEDITFRALKVLKEADLIVAEDTRRTSILCSHYAITTKLRSFHSYSSPKTLQSIVSRLSEGENICLVTDAGTPSVSDPGTELVAEARKANIEVIAIPGPSALTAAVSICGLQGDGLLFLGFLPRSGTRRKKALVRLRSSQECVVFFESPFRLKATIQELAKCLPERNAAIFRELTKIHEEALVGSFQELDARLQEVERVRGEITIVVEPSTNETGATPARLEDDELQERIETLQKEGLSTSAMAKSLALEDGRSKQELYDYIVHMKKTGESES
ncbi:MAG: 16S rRNA (cytidine(1402)-2'-O)-methyltransferase [Myxococcales bacterium]|nr:MAG: 16S rRNA (cytidine(1402)-2'-O)-methyltransferase [Myxococcales bacterium]